MYRSIFDALFLSLAAAGILQIQNTTEGFMWIIGSKAIVVKQQHACVMLVEATIGTAKYIQRMRIGLGFNNIHLRGLVLGLLRFQWLLKHNYSNYILSHINI